MHAFVHSCSTNFIITKRNKSSNVGFSYIDAFIEYPSINPERVKAKNIIELIKKEIDFNLIWNDFLCAKLKKNKWYYYYNGREIGVKGNFCNK